MTDSETRNPPETSPVRPKKLLKKKSRSAIALKVAPEDQRPHLPTLGEQLKRDAYPGGMGVLVSLAFHIPLALILALLVFTQAEGDGDFFGLVAGWTTPTAPQRSFDPKAPTIVTIDAINQPNVQPKPVNPRKNEPPKSVSDVPKAVAGGLPKVDKALTGRDEESRDRLLKMFGGTRKTEGAVSMGLSWLAKHQKSDGRWELHQGYDDPGLEHLRTDTGATALGLLAMLGAGNTPTSGVHKERVSKALEWLKRTQKSNGDFHDFQELGRVTAFYAHGQATIAMCEAYALTGDESLRKPIELALNYINEGQNELGGWRYQPKSEGDLSVTGWQIMALQSARMAHIDVDEQVLSGASLFLDSVSVQTGSRYKYLPTDPDSKTRLSMTAEGLLCRQYLGWPREHPAMMDGVAHMLEPQNLPKWSDGRRNVYYWYYATQVLHHIGGESWKTWNEAMKEAITSNQVRAGKMAGSWHPTIPQGAPYEDADKGGRLYVTVMCLLNLEVYYRHLPIYEEFAPDDSETAENSSTTESP